MIKLNLGSGSYFAKGYINVDKFVEEMNPKKGDKFVEGDILHLPFRRNYADLVEAHQVIEHISIKDQIPAYKEIYRVMKKGAKLQIDVPSFNGLCLEWLGMELRTGNQFNPAIWYDRAEEFYGIQVHEGEYHRCPQTPNWIAYCLREAGFKNSPKMIIFPKNGFIPREKKFGIMATSPKPYGDQTVFRHETIFVEICK